jgi:hypothetical protein
VLAFLAEYRAEMYREVEGDDVILEKDPNYVLTDAGKAHLRCNGAQPLTINECVCLLVTAPLPNSPNPSAPAKPDINQYAAWLGMDPELDRHLLWIARAGLNTDLPEDWRPCKSPEGEVYYFNFNSGDSTWDHPCDEEFRQLYREQRQLAVIAAQQRLAWTACTLASGNTPRDDSREQRGRERRLAALKKRRGGDSGGARGSTGSRGHPAAVARRGKAAAAAAGSAIPATLSRRQRADPSRQRPQSTGSSAASSPPFRTLTKARSSSAEEQGQAATLEEERRAPASGRERTTPPGDDDVASGTAGGDESAGLLRDAAAPNSPPGSLPPDSPTGSSSTRRRKAGRTAQGVGSASKSLA